MPAAYNQRACEANVKLFLLFGEVNFQMDLRLVRSRTRCRRRTALPDFRPSNNTHFKCMEIGKACIVLHNAAELEYFKQVVLSK